MLAITSKKVIMCDRTLFGENTAKYYYKDINSVEYRKGRYSGHVTIFIGDKYITFGDMTGEDPVIATNMITEHINKINPINKINIKAPELMKSKIKKKTQTDNPLSILNTRLAEGRISVEDYQRRKDVLQGDARTVANECPSCGNLVSESEKYCIECGFHLKD